jgi:hypothetical protein
MVQGHCIRLGSRAWLERAGIPIPGHQLRAGSASYLAIDGAFRGTFVLTHSLLPETEQFLRDERFLIGFLKHLTRRLLFASAPEEASR